MNTPTSPARRARHSWWVVPALWLALTCTLLVLPAAGTATAARQGHVQLAATSAPGARAAASAQDTPRQTYTRQAFARTNRHRAAKDLVKLRSAACLRTVAVAQAKKMRAAQGLSHQDLGAVMRRCDLRTAGENVAYGYPSGTAVVTQGWMKSRGHRANILTSRYRLMAIGAVRDKNGTWWVAQVFGRR